MEKKRDKKNSQKLIRDSICREINQKIQKLSRDRRVKKSDKGRQKKEDRRQRMAKKQRDKKRGR